MIIDYTTTVDYIPEPTYSTDGAAGMDLRAAIKGAKTIKPGEVVKVDDIGFPDKDMRVKDSLGKIWYINFCDVSPI